jgi:hypothetical protein
MPSKTDASAPSKCDCECDLCTDGYCQGCLDRATSWLSRCDLFFQGSQVNLIVPSPPMAHRP